MERPTRALVQLATVGSQSACRDAGEPLQGFNMRRMIDSGKRAPAQWVPSLMGT